MPAIDHPLMEFVIKVATRCDLGCPHCYFFFMADQSWKNQPKFMSHAIYQRTVERIADYARRHQLPEVRIIWHGGEPLLAGPKRLQEFAEVSSSLMPPGTQLRLSVQTNGTQLTSEMIAVLRTYNVSVGVSLDGTETDNDRLRPFRDGRGSHAVVTEALHRLNQPDTRRIYGGILCTINLEADPLTTYRHLVTFKPPNLDFILPLGHWGAPPPGLDTGPHRAPYADWLTWVFKDWYYVLERTHRPSIRLFEQIMTMLMDQPGSTGFIGPSPRPSVVVEANGDIELVDALKSTFEGAPATGLNILTPGFTFDDFDALPAIRNRQRSSDDLCATCRSCALKEICGGGYLPHRYNPADDDGRRNPFDNPSVYCADLADLITTIRYHLKATLDAYTKRKTSTPSPII